MKKSKYIINKEENNKISWIKINMPDGSVNTEIIDNTKEELREIKKLNRKYPDLLEKYENKDYQEKEEVIENLKISKWSKILSGSSIVFISTTSSLLIESDLIFHKLTSIISFLGSYLIATGFDLEKEIKELSKNQIDILLKKETYTNKLKQGKNIKNQQLNKYTISGILFTAFSLLNLEISASLIEVIIKTQNPEILKILANFTSLISGISLKKGTNGIINMVNFKYNENNYLLSNDEQEILTRKKKKML